MGRMAIIERVVYGVVLLAGVGRALAQAPTAIGSWLLLAFVLVMGATINADALATRRRRH